MKNGGLQALLYELLNEDISAYDLESSAPDTEAFEVK